MTTEYRNIDIENIYQLIEEKSNGERLKDFLYNRNFSYDALKKAKKVDDMKLSQLKELASILDVEIEELIIKDVI